MDAVGVLERDDDRRLPWIQIELERSLPCVGEQAPLECRVNPRSRDETGPVRGGARDEPIDSLPYSLAIDDAFLDQQLLERTGPSGGGRLTADADRLVRMVVIVVAHSASSSQCSKRSTRSVSSARPR